MNTRRLFLVVSFAIYFSLAAAATARAQLTQPQLRELVRDGLRDDSIRHGEPNIDYSRRDVVEINLGWVEIDDPDPLWFFPYSDQCLVELIRAKYEKNPAEALAWQPHLKQAEALIAKEVALLQAYEKTQAARPPAAQGAGHLQLKGDAAPTKPEPSAPRGTRKSFSPPPAPPAPSAEPAAPSPAPAALRPSAPKGIAPSPPSAKEATPAPPAPQATADTAPSPAGSEPADDDAYVNEPQTRDFPSWPQLEGDLPFEEQEISRALNDISYGVERAILARIDAEAYRQQKIVRYVEQPRGAALPVYDILVHTAPPGASVYYLNELTFARYSRDGSVDNVSRFWTAVGSGSVQLAGKWRFVAVWPDGRRSAMQQFHIIKKDAIELVPEARPAGRP